MGYLIILVLVLAVFSPFLRAIQVDYPAKGTIFILCLLFGWTVVGMLIAGLCVESYVDQQKELNGQWNYRG